MAQNDSKRDYSSSEDDEEEEEASGSEDQQASGSDSDEASDSSSEPKQNPEPKKITIVNRKPDSPSLDSEESSSDTDSDLPPKKSSLVDVMKIKPISSKPMDREVSNPEVKLVKKAGSKASATPSPAKSKRPANTPTASEKDPKKAKSNTVTDDEIKKRQSPRVWSEDDEIVILKGLIEYKNVKNGENPIADHAAFHEFIKKSLHADVSKGQLYDKVRRLKKKYENNAGRVKDGLRFSKSHEQKGYELSKLIWGSGNDTSGTGTGTESKKNQSQKTGNGKGNAASTSTAATAALVKSNGVDDKEVLKREVEKKMDVSRFVKYGGGNDSPVLPEEIVKAGMELLEGSKRVELEERWSNLKKQELELYLKRMDLVKEQALLVLEAVNSSGK